jgi:pimeloyl-ACP methyl ester carboxylesterase
MTNNSNGNSDASRTPPADGVRHLDRGEGRLAYDVVGPGDAPLVVCLPGMGDLRQLYRHNVASLRAAGYRVATMDLRGHGDSDTTFERYDDFAAASDIVALVETLGGPAMLYGNSMCAAASVLTAADRPDLVAGLVLAGPFVRDQPTSKAMQLLLQAALLRPWGRASWLMYHKKAYPGRRPDDFAAYERRLSASLRRTPHWKAFVATTRQTVHAPVEHRLAEVKAPALVVMGTRDPDFKNPTAEARYVADRLRAQLLLVDGAGHYAMAEYPEIVNPRVLTFAATVFGA